jgi:D-cysteine desulfhydrase family pyridoxal phosphate-dependent enzyme
MKDDGGAGVSSRRFVSAFGGGSMTADPFARLADIPRVALAHLPTPLEPMINFQERLGGPRLFVKRDDATGLATGGNKARKLEFLMADALRQRADTIVTVGAVQSNHARQTAAAAAKLGLRCILALTQTVPIDTAAYRMSGNALIDRLTGVEIRLFPGDADTARVSATIADELKQHGRRPYVIPVGGSTPVGSLGYALAAKELLDQADAQGIRIDAIVHGSGSGGTQAGLLVGLAALGRAIPVIGISVSAPEEKQRAKVRVLIEPTATLLGLSTIDAEVVIDDRFVGAGYGLPTPAMREAVELVAASEGLLLDPVYAGKAMAGLIARARRGDFTAAQTVVFLHTGGSAALFAYIDQFANDARGRP